MLKTEPYSGPFPRKRHSHTCLTCKQTTNQGAVACYKAGCTKPQTVHRCQWCEPLRPSVTLPAPAPLSERDQVSIWYGAIGESKRRAILSALSESQRRQAFQYGLAVSWALLPQYGRDLVHAEWWNDKNPVSVAPSDSGRTRAGDTPECEDCGRPLERCSCGDAEDSQLSLFGGAL